MNKFKVRYNPEEYKDFINEILVFSNGENEFGIGYPRCDNIEELISEVELYENTLSKSICIIYDENILIGFSGFLYTEGEDEGYIIGPLLKKEYYNKENMEVILNLVLDSFKNKCEKLLAVCTDENKVLNECYIKNGWNYKETQREMCFKIDNIDRDVKFKVNELSIDELKSNEAIFNLLDKNFNWHGDKENYNELLRDEYKTGCVFNNENEVIGAVVWSFLDNVDFSRLEYLVVNENYRNRGLGRAMINYVINDSKDKGVENIFLSTGINNAAANLYSSVGFYDTVVSNIYEKSLQKYN